MSGTKRKANFDSGEAGGAANAERALDEHIVEHEKKELHHNRHEMESDGMIPAHGENPAKAALRASKVAAAAPPKATAKKKKR
ncbi:MAG: hypothetical protein ABJD07_07890 [Gemmatimonadaceae bacterium]